MSLIDVPLTDFLANFVTLDEYPKKVESFSPGKAVFSCPDCDRRVVVVTSPLASAKAVTYPSPKGEGLPASSSGRTCA